MAQTDVFGFGRTEGGDGLELGLPHDGASHEPDVVTRSGLGSLSVGWIIWVPVTRKVGISKHFKVVISELEVDPLVLGSS